MMRTCGLCLFVLFFFTPLVGQNCSSWEELWNRKGVRHAAIGISVKNTRDGRVVYEYHQGMALSPASVLKLFPTLLALKRKGDSLRYTTNVFYTGSLKNGILSGDIRVQAGGDPCLDSKFFPDTHFMDQLVDAIVQLGIKRVEGTIVVEEGKELSSIPGSWMWEDVANYYAALYHPFNYKDNTYTICFSSGEANTATRIVSVKPFIPGVTLRNEVKASERDRDDAWIFGGPEASTLVVRGSIPAGRSLFSVRGAMHHPAIVFTGELESRLQAQGILICNHRDVPTDRHALLTVYSPYLKEIIFHTNKRSVNLFAEALGRLVGDDDFETAVKRELGLLGIDSSGITLKDACGLSPLNAVPARVFTDLLLWAKVNRVDSFLASLPRGGIDGGVRLYAAHPALQGHLQAKTGSFSGVRALAGYLDTRDGETLAFTILINHYTGDALSVQETIRDFLILLFQE